MLFRTIPFLTLLIGFLSMNLAAVELRSATPATDTVLVLHFNEGHIDQGLDEKDARPYISKLDTKAAGVASNYTITSEDDPRFKTGQHPTKIGRKAKAADTLSHFRPEKFVLEHWVYLVLPQALQRGCTYTVRVEGQAQQAATHTFLFHEFILRSETIHVSQAGFTPDGPKYAYLSHWMGDLSGLNLETHAGRAFHVVRTGNNETTFSGKVAKRKDLKTGAPLTATPEDGKPWNGGKKMHTPKNFTAADIFECDFSAFKDPGTYRIVVEGLGCSFPFVIDADAYRRAYYVASRGLFFQRAGIEKEVEPGLNYPRGHHPDDGLNAFEYDKDWRFIDRPDHNAKIKPTGTLKVWGWYHDAGDWDGYPGHVHVPLSLLLLYDLAGDKFTDGQVGNRYKSNSADAWIEEGKNGIPDLLDEAAWLIQYYRRARAEGLRTGLTTGGVPGGYSGVDSCAGGASWRDKRPLKISAEDPATTYQYAACAAWLAICLDKAAPGSTESAAWLKEAQAAYSWAQANTKTGDEPKILSQRMLAALCLYRATKDTAFHTQFAADIKKDPALQRSEEGWFCANWWEYAAGIYALLPVDFPGLDSALQQQLRDKVIEVSDKEFVKTASDRGYRAGFDWNKLHALGTFSTPVVFQPAIAYKLTGAKKYLEVLHTSAAYCLGGNPMNMTWMTGFGQRAVKFPFHPDSWALIDYNSMVYANEILPGMVPYGSCESVDFFGPGFHFTGDEDFSRSSAYPDVESWPLSETRFENRYSISGGEFTIVQNTAPSIFAYGFLCGPAGKSAVARTRPGVALVFPEEQAVFKAGGDVALRVKVTPGVERVEYYCNERYIGAADTPPFAFVWRDAPQGAWLLTAKAFDETGQVSKPNNPAFDVDVKIRVETAAPEVPATKVELLNAPQQALNPNTVWTLTATVIPFAATGHDVEWTSSDPKIATVNSLGQVVAKAAGKAIITVKSKHSSHTAACQIQVTAASAKP